ncbi:MAG: glycosylhydrolase-like jelly roll fold domain-containing protein [Bryobacteraceae bacterium]
MPCTGRTGPVGIDSKYQLDFQLVRGVTALQLRVPALRGGGDPSTPPPATFAAPPQAAMVAWYTNRGGYLMAIGRPAAQVGLYHPGNSIWMGDQEADRSATMLGWQLFEHQVDWDYFDEQSLSSVATIEDGGFKNLSGQVYKAIIFPSMTVITRTALERLRAFVKTGGKAIFVGKTPGLIVDKTFLHAKDVPDLSFATLIEPSGDITASVLAALPKPDVKLDAEFPRLTYTHRSWRDAEMYFFFNESNQAESRVATIAGRGHAQAWDLATGEIHPLSAATANGDSVHLPLVLGPYEAKVLVVGPLPSGVGASEPSFAAGTMLAELGGHWTLDLNGKQIITSLKSWEDLGTQSFAGPATYRKQFTGSGAPAGKRVFLEFVDVNDYARVKLNGRELEAHGWQPYRWEVTNLVKAGSNDLEVEVRTTAGGRGAVPAASGLLGPVRLVER